MNIAQLPFMAQLAAMAANNPELVATQAAAKGVAAPAAGAGGAPSLGELLAGQPGGGIIGPAPAGTMNPTIQNQMQQPMEAPPVVIPPGAGMPPTPTPATAAGPQVPSVQDLTAAMGALGPTGGGAGAGATPMAPAAPVPAAHGGPNPNITALIAQLLGGGGGGPAQIPSLGALIGGR